MNYDYENEQKIRELEREIEDLRRRNQELEEEINNLKNSRAEDCRTLESIRSGIQGIIYQQNDISSKIGDLESEINNLVSKLNW
jgi:chromosome segregation ATPase